MGYLEQNERLGRLVFPDLVRAWALFGIAVVNVAFFYSATGIYNTQELATSLDKTAYLLVNGLFLAKSYTLFSFMFGVGFAFQIQSAENKRVFSETQSDSPQLKTDIFWGRYGRRIAGLLFLGLLHGVFFFVGDILFVYGLLSLALLLFRNLSVKALLWWAAAFFAVQVTVLGLLSVLFYFVETIPEIRQEMDMDEIMKEFAKADEIFRNGTFFEVANRRAVDWGGMVMLGTIFQGGGVLAFFLLGYAAVKSGILNNTAHPLWRKFRLFCLPIGLLGSFYAATVIGKSENMISFNYFWGTFLIFLFAPLSTAGYLGVFAKLSEGKVGPIKAFFARAGTSSLTAYLMQSLIMSIIFCGYGFGMHGKLSASQVIMIATATATFTLVFASLWRLKFERGPMEILLRRWTYKGEAA